MQWHHGTCQSIEIEQVAMPTKLNKRGVRWHCEGCVPGLPSTGTTTEGTTLQKLTSIEHADNTLNDKFSKYQEESSLSVDKLKTLWADIAKSNQGELAKEVKKAVAVSINTQAMISHDLENKDDESRVVNAILYGLPESEQSVIDQEDQLIKKELFKGHNKPPQAIRLGHKNNDKARPIKLRFSDEKNKWEFLKRANSGLRDENIFCKLDRCKQSRDRELALRKKHMCS